MSAAVESGGKMLHEQVERVVKRLDDDTPLFVTVLEKLSKVHFHRFCEIGMGIHAVVKKVLGWIQGSTEPCLTTLSNVNRRPDLAQRTSTVENRLLRNTDYPGPIE